MGWDIDLQCADCGQPVRVPAHNEGSIQQMNMSGEMSGTTEASVLITYNYSPHFDFSLLGGKTGHDTIPMLRDAMVRLGTVRDKDYWAKTPGNAGAMCAVLLQWATLHPRAIWKVT